MVAYTATTVDAPIVGHTSYRMQECAIHRGIKTVGLEPSWCRLNSEYHKSLAPFFIPSYWQQVNNVRMVVSPQWRGPGNILEGKYYRYG